MALSVIILAAGQGKRMCSAKPKVLHSLAGKPLLEHVIEAAARLPMINHIYVVYGHGGEVVPQTLAHCNVTWVKQDQQLGTGHAVLQALPLIAETDRVLILYGDVPLITSATLENFINTTATDELGIITAELPDPTGFGRIIRDKKGAITAIIEHRDATQEEQKIREINTGIYLLPAKHLANWLNKISKKNSQVEYYLTDIAALANQQGIPIKSLHCTHVQEISGVNDRVQLATLERYLQHRYAEKLQRQGVTLLDPARFDVRGELHAAADVTIDINVIIEGKVSIASGCVIGPNVLLRNTTLGKNVEVRAHSVIDGAHISDDCVIGPFARIRPETTLAAAVHIGNFVEIKNCRIGAKTKANHLSYLGDSEVGMGVNIGAGTITCNYDGINKNRTSIGNGAFIGSNTALVAPICVGEGAFIGAGSTITRDAPAHQLTVSRARQSTIAGWQPRQKKPLKEKT